jgi:hypothetical protein
MLVAAWPAVLIWVCVWGLHFAVSRNLHGANIVATVLSPAVLWLLPVSLTAPMLRHGESLGELVILFSVMCAIILVRHIGFFSKAFTSSTIP